MGCAVKAIGTMATLSKQCRQGIRELAHAMDGPLGHRSTQPRSPAYLRTLYDILVCGAHVFHARKHAKQRVYNKHGNLPIGDAQVREKDLGTRNMGKVAQLSALRTQGPHEQITAEASQSPIARHQTKQRERKPNPIMTKPSLDESLAYIHCQSNGTSLTPLECHQVHPTRLELASQRLSIGRLQLIRKGIFSWLCLFIPGANW
ncbi:hypothetical protein FA13DRAFT_1713975 [Coprinellus micaceus]|uniref:Uncharacterized protein n=1 Tax=Coprinellus micaceus TaxID=71717 RepID=A0A4Y7STZ1_COPMI|nr:hypothetical protein FA13DRAFT_1713975 [Coprinellus micaceus]